MEFFQAFQTISDSLDEFITLPTLNTTKIIMQEIQDKSGFPFCVGYVDGTLTKISTPPASGGAFFCRKQFDAFNNMVSKYYLNDLTVMI